MLGALPRGPPFQTLRRQMTRPGLRERTAGIPSRLRGPRGEARPERDEFVDNRHFAPSVVRFTPTKSDENNGRRVVIKKTSRHGANI